MKLDSIAKAYLSQYQLDEQLLPKEENEADRMRANGHTFHQQRFIDAHPKAKEVFENSPYLEQNGNPRQFAARIPIELDTSVESPHPDVTRFLERNGYHFSNDEYKSGIAKSTKTVGNPDQGIPYSTKITQHKIGGLLEKHKASDEIKKAFVNDPFRANAKTEAYDMVLTGNHRDIFGSSTGRSYTSCADKRPRKDGEVPGWREYDGNGPAAQKMKEEINNNTFNAYIIPRGGDVDKDVIGRISFKRHNGLTTGHPTLFQEGRTYGNNMPKAFIKKSNEVVSSLFDRKNDIYLKNQHVYDDDGVALKTVGFDANNRPSSEQLDFAYKALKNSGFDQQFHHLYAHVDPDQKYKTKKLKDIAKAISNIKNTVASGNFNDSIAAFNGLDTALENNYLASESLLQNPHVSDLMNKTASLFDIKNKVHHSGIISATRGYGPSNLITSKIANKASSSIAAKNYDDFASMVSLRDSSNGAINFGGHSRYSPIPIHSDHEFGNDPMDTILRTADKKNQLDHTMFHAAYMSFRDHGTNHGNFYDTAHHFEQQGIPGMSNIIRKIADTNLKGNTASEIAERFYDMKPATRERFASEIHDWIGGRTAKQFMQDNKAHIDSYKAMRNENAKKATQTISESFTYSEEEEERDFSI